MEGDDGQTSSKMKTSINRILIVTLRPKSVSYCIFVLRVLESRRSCRKKRIMSRVLSFLKTRPVLSYYFLVFTISWGGILILIGGPGNIPGTKEQAEKLLIPALLVMFSGPFISGILMNFLVDGQEGLRKLLLQFLRWRVKAQ